MRLATETLGKINQLLEKDQGARFREILGQVIPHIGDAFRSEEDTFRGHMGASLIGRDCGREIWYSWRWVTKSKFPGRILRLFNRGHLEEARFIALLLMAGVQVFQQDENGKQFRVSGVNGHFGGSGDGIGLNIPDLPPNQQAVLEFKTHNEKSFTELTKKGVKEAKFEHYVQMNIYMNKMGIPVALYGAVNKNNDELYFEIIELDRYLAEQFEARADTLVHHTNAPKRISSSPGFFKCRFCDHRPVCHLSAIPERNCRTCTFSRPGNDGGWQCVKFNCDLSKELQLTGCVEYNLSGGIHATP